jgi:hypothetical protein
MKDLGGTGYTPFERELLSEVFDAPTAAAEVFKKQIPLSRVTSREFSGSGSFTNIEVSPDAPSALGICGTPAEQRWVAIWRPGMDAPAGCVVFVDKAGFINCLEVYTHSSTPWADDPPTWIIAANERWDRNPFDRPN